MIKSKSVKTILFSISSLLIFILVFYFVFYTNKPVTLVVDGIEITTYNNENMVEDVLDENNVVLEDGVGVVPSQVSKTKSGDKIVLKSVVPVVFYNGNHDPYEIMTTASTVSEFLQEQGIDLDENDIVTPSLDSNIFPGGEVNVIYVDYKVYEEKINIDYETEVTYNDSLYVDQQNIVREGQPGIRVVSKEKYFENGIEKSEKVIYDNVDVKPVNKIIEKGTKEREAVHVSGPSSLNEVQNAYSNGQKISLNGQEYSVVGLMNVEATAFYDSGKNGNNITATGNPTTYNPAGFSTIAVDPRVIPLNTKVYIEGYGFGVAHDTGGAIKGHIIDVFMPSKTAAYDWGRKKGIKMYILK